MSTKKADFIWFNGEMVKWEDAKVSVMSHALHYGTSVFEGVRCYDSHKGPVVFRHREHMKRLHESAKIYRFPIEASVDELMEACREVIRVNKLKSAYIRPLAFVGDVGLGVLSLGVLTWALKRWKTASMRWFLRGTALHQIPCRPPQKPVVTIFPLCW
jgi:branched-chain amino acid aminotransferase